MMNGIDLPALRQRYSQAYRALPKPLEVSNKNWTIYQEAMNLMDDYLEPRYRELAHLHSMSPSQLDSIIAEVDLRIRQDLQFDPSQFITPPNDWAVRLFSDLLQAVPRFKMGVATLRKHFTLTRITDLCNLTRTDLLSVEGIGEKTVSEVEAFLLAHGLHLQEERKLPTRSCYLILTFTDDNPVRTVASFVCDNKLVAYQDYYSLGGLFHPTPDIPYNFRLTLYDNTKRVASYGLNRRQSEIILNEFFPHSVHWTPVNINS